MQIFQNHYGGSLTLVEFFTHLKFHYPSQPKLIGGTFLQSLHVYMGIWTLVIDEMLVLKPAQYSQSVCSSCAQSHEENPLSHKTFITCRINACACHSDYFCVIACLLATKTYTIDHI